MAQLWKRGFARKLARFHRFLNFGPSLLAVQPHTLALATHDEYLVGAVFRSLQ